MPLHREVLPAIDLLRRAADVENEAALKANITFRFDAGPVKVSMSIRNAFCRCLSELVSNAIKFSPAQTIIKLGAQAYENDTVCILRGRSGPRNRRRTSWI
jgi:signal transduction histidine kinase